MKEKPEKSQYIYLASSGVAASFCAAYLTFFYQDILIARRGASPRSLHLLMLFIILVLLFMGVGWLSSKWKQPLLSMIHRWRYAIGVIAIALLTLFKISGSSVSAWSSIIGGDNFQGTLWGIPRSIRSDEYVVFTPFAFSQEYTHYASTSNILRAFPTDVTMLYAQPSWALATLFRPFLWGFMLFGSQHGLAFFWSARLIILLLISYEFGRWLTNDCRGLAASYALCIGFAPIIQWWFAVNGTAELMIFGQALVLLFSRYLNTTLMRDSWVCGVLIAYCCGGYALILYPAWQVPLFYVFGALGISILWRFVTVNRSRLVHSSSVANTLLIRYIMPVIVSLIPLIVAMGWIIYSSRETISTMLHTAYPGARVETGGGLSGSLFNYMQSLFGALYPQDAYPNVCEQAVFISLFPLGIILAIAYLIKHKGSKDTTLVMLLGVDAVLLAFGLCGFPVWLSKATLLSNVTVRRLQMATTLIDVMLLFRALSLIRDQIEPTPGLEEKKSHESLILRHYIIPITVACGISGLLIIGSALCSTFHIRPLIVFEMFVAMTFCFFLILQSVINRSKMSAYIMLIAVIIAVSGVCINPIQYGTASLTNNETINTVKHELTRLEGKGNAVLATDSPFLGQAFIANGIPTITSTNSIPALDRWRKIDSSGKYKDVYNRYAHIEFNIKQKGVAYFELKNGHPDYVIVHLTVDDLKKIGVRYLYTNKKVRSTENTRIIDVINVDNGVLYQIK